MAWKFTWKSHEDYLLTRLGLLNGFFSALEMGTQTVEKLLKSYILFKDKSLNGDPYKILKKVSKISKKLRNKSHDIEACLELAMSNGLSILQPTRDKIMKINEMYELRYPDNNWPRNCSTKELIPINESVFEIWDNFKKLNIDYYYISGILTPIYVYFSNLDNPFTQKDFNVFTNKNKAYANRKLEIESEIAKRLKI